MKQKQPQIIWIQGKKVKQRVPVSYRTPQFTRFECGMHFTESFKTGESGDVVTSAPTRSVVISLETPCPVCNNPMQIAKES